MIWVAIRAMGMLQTFETSGTVRLARGLASRMYTVSFWIAYWMFISPTTFSSMAILRLYWWMVSMCLGGMLIGGITQAESPEWMPASSMCSITAGTKASWPSARRRPRPRWRFPGSGR